MSQAASLPEFVARWQASALTEKSAAQTHFIELCQTLGTPAYRMYTVPASDGKAAYTVLVNGTDYACTCPAGESGRICYHIGAVIMAVAARRLAPVMDARLLEPNRTPSRSPLWAKAA